MNNIYLAPMASNASLSLAPLSQNIWQNFSAADLEPVDLYAEPVQNLLPHALSPRTLAHPLSFAAGLTATTLAATVPAQAQAGPVMGSIISQAANIANWVFDFFKGQEGPLAGYVLLSTVVLMTLPPTQTLGKRTTNRLLEKRNHGFDVSEAQKNLVLCRKFNKVHTIFDFLLLGGIINLTQDRNVLAAYALLAAGAAVAAGAKIIQTRMLERDLKRAPRLSLQQDLTDYRASFSSYLQAIQNLTDQLSDFFEVYSRFSDNPAKNKTNEIKDCIQLARDIIEKLSSKKYDAELQTSVLEIDIHLREAHRLLLEVLQMMPDHIIDISELPTDQQAPVHQKIKVLREAYYDLGLCPEILQKHQTREYQEQRATANDVKKKMSLDDARRAVQDALERARQARAAQAQRGGV